MLFNSNSLLETLFFFSFSFIYANAAPHIHSRIIPQDTYHERLIGRGLKVKIFHPKSTFSTFDDGLDQPTTLLPVDSISNSTSTLTGAPSIQDLAVSFMADHFTLNATDMDYQSGYLVDGGKYAYMTQSHNGVSFANAVANVAWRNGKIVSVGSSFVKPESIASSTPTLDVTAVIAQTEEALDGVHNGQTPTLEYLVQPDGSASLTHVIQIENEEKGTFVEAFVCAHTGNILSITDFVAHASYTVVPNNKLSPDDGIETLTDPQDLSSSPLGWHNDGTTVTGLTSGNNVVASSSGLLTVQSVGDLNFNFPMNANQDPTQGSNVDAARTNAFYILNTVHDVAYRYGFTEEAFNFQNNNMGRGGRGGDPVLVSVQDASGLNNAQFSTPPDGQPGRCKMFLFTQTSPRRDGSLENDIIIHEAAHGISSRMTGGGSGRCLRTLESGGLGEGWSDMFANWFQQKSANTADFAVGVYVTGKARGLRSNPYSTSLSTNPLTYRSAGLRQNQEVHRLGEVWANILHNVYAALVAEFGFSSNAQKDANGPEGNIVFMRNLINGFALQACNPTFLDARDAIILSDQNLYGGRHVCTMRKAFASRGMGLNAANFVDDNTIPANC